VILARYPRELRVKLMLPDGAVELVQVMRERIREVLVFCLILDLLLSDRIVGESVTKQRALLKF
jgi:hypothetical protein